MPDNDFVQAMYAGMPGPDLAFMDPRATTIPSPQLSATHLTGQFGPLGTMAGGMIDMGMGAMVPDYQMMSYINAGSTYARHSAMVQQQNLALIQQMGQSHRYQQLSRFFDAAGVPMASGAALAAQYTGFGDLLLGQDLSALGTYGLIGFASSANNQFRPSLLQTHQTMTAFQAEFMRGSGPLGDLSFTSGMSPDEIAIGLSELHRRRGGTGRREMYNVTDRMQYETRHQIAGMIMRQAGVGQDDYRRRGQFMEQFRQSLEGGATVDEATMRGLNAAGIDAQGRNLYEEVRNTDEYRRLSQRVERGTGFLPGEVISYQRGELAERTRMRASGIREQLGNLAILRESGFIGNLGDMMDMMDQTFGQGTGLDPARVRAIATNIAATTREAGVTFEQVQGFFQMLQASPGAAGMDEMQLLRVGNRALRDSRRMEGLTQAEQLQYAASQAQATVSVAGSRQAQVMRALTLSGDPGDRALAARLNEMDPLARARAERELADRGTIGGQRAQLSRFASQVFGDLRNPETAGGAMDMLGDLEQRQAARAGELAAMTDRTPAQEAEYQSIIRSQQQRYMSADANLEAARAGVGPVGRRRLAAAAAAVGRADPQGEEIFARLAELRRSQGADFTIGTMLTEMRQRNIDVDALSEAQISDAYGRILQLSQENDDVTRFGRSSMAADSMNLANMRQEIERENDVAFERSVREDVLRAVNQSVDDMGLEEEEADRQRIRLASTMEGMFDIFVGATVDPDTRAGNLRALQSISSPGQMREFMESMDILARDALSRDPDISPEELERLGLDDIQAGTPLSQEVLQARSRAMGMLVRSGVQDAPETLTALATSFAGTMRAEREQAAAEASGAAASTSPMMPEEMQLRGTINITMQSANDGVGSPEDLVLSIPKRIPGRGD